MSEAENKKRKTNDDREEIEKIQIPSSSGQTPVQHQINAERRTFADGTTNKLDMDVLENIKGIQQLNPNVESLEQKPWRKPNANISDYFNYGFDEESWNTYCKKQAQLCRNNRRLFAKLMAQKGHSGCAEEESCAHSSSSTRASRESNATTDVTEELPGSSSKEEQHQCLSVGGNDTQLSFFDQAPLLPPSQLFWTVFPSPFESGVLQQGNLWTCRTVCPEDQSWETLLHFDGPPTSLYPCSSGSLTSTEQTDFAWECYLQQTQFDKDSGSSREHGHDKENNRDREMESCSSSHSSGDTTEPGLKRSSDRVGGTRQTDKNEGWQRTSQSRSDRSSSRSDDGEDRDRKHKQKGPEK